MVLREYGAPLQLEDIERPAVGPDDMLVRVLYCGICGTDLKIVEGKLPGVINLPHVPGHEIAGEVVEVGSRVDTVWIGKRGVVYPYVSCKDCTPCRKGRENVCVRVKRVGFELNGGFAEYVRIPSYNFCEVRVGKDLLKGFSVLADAGLTPYHALKGLASLSAGQKVLIVGAGGLGLHAVQVARVLGARVAVLEVREQNQALAKTLGAELLLRDMDNAGKQQLSSWTRGQGVDVVLEGVGSQDTFEWALSCLGRGGTLIVMGYDPDQPLRFNSKEMHYNEWQIKGTRLGTKQELVELLELATEGNLQPIITEHVAMQEVNRGIEMLRKGKAVGRIVLEGF